jgi:tetratricopeptide (TPR) repeat protein
MTDQPKANNAQTILDGATVDGNIKIDNIFQIIKIVNNFDNLPKPTGFPQNIPSSNTDKFVGRERDLVSLHDQLQQNQTVAIAAVEGMGGVGKTELAIQYSLLYLQLNTYPGGICWLRARDEDLGLQIVNFARTDLGLQPPDDLELPARVRWCWKRWKEENTLIVLDDVKNYSEITPYLPPQPSQFKVLITTRLKLDLAGSLFLEVLSEPDALLLLFQLLGEEKVTNELATAKELCQRLGYLPLALQLVGQYLKKSRITLAEMLKRLESKGLGHPSLEVKANDPTWTLNIKNGVAAAFELSWSELSESAQELGCALSLFALAPIPWSLVESAIPEQDPENLEDARIELENWHLLQGEDTYQLHQLIREFFSNKQSNLAIGEEQKDNFCQALVKIAQGIPESPTIELINSVKNAIPHLAIVAENLTDTVRDENLIWVFAGLDRVYSGQGLYAQAEPWREQFLLLVQTRLGAEHPFVASSLHNLTNLYLLQGRYKEAKPIHLKALEMRKRLLGEEHPSVAGSLHNLAYLYSSQGRHKEAELLYLKTLEMRKRLFGEEHPSVASSLNNLACLYKSQGRYAEAEPIHLRALEMRKRLLGEEHPSVATSLDNLAGLYESQGRYADAEPLYLKALEMRKRLLGKEHPSVATSLNSLAELYRLQGRYADAEPLYLKALEMRKRLLGEEHPSVAISLNNLANLYSSQERYTDAEPLYLKSLEMRKRLLGKEHPKVANSLNNLACLYSSQERYTDAEPLYLKSLEMRKRLLRSEHPDIATSLNNLASLYKSQGRYTEAEPLCIQALEIAEQSLGVNHPSTITIRKNLKVCRDNQT